MFLLLPFTFLQQFCAEQLALYSYQNYLEVIFFSVIIYKSLRWLQSDYTKSMTLSIYAYSAVLATSHLMHAPVLFWTLVMISPIVAILCIIFHQTKLQKYLASSSMRSFNGQIIVNEKWPELLVRSALMASYHKKNIFCIISGSDNLSYFVQAPYSLNVPIQNDLLDLLLASPMIENPSIMMVDHFGNLKYINATWSEQMHDKMIVSAHHSPIEHCQQAATIISSFTDGMVWQIDPLSKKATLWYESSVIENASVDQLLAICQKMRPTASKENKEKKGDFHVSKPYRDLRAPSQH